MSPKRVKLGERDAEIKLYLSFRCNSPKLLHQFIKAGVGPALGNAPQHRNCSPCTYAACRLGEQAPATIFVEY
jgi:hypothetical protein